MQDPAVTPAVRGPANVKAPSGVEGARGEGSGSQELDN